MRPTKASLTVDRVNIILHWLLVIGVSLVLGIAGVIAQYGVIMVFAAAIWTINAAFCTSRDLKRPASVSLMPADSMGSCGLACFRF